MPRFSVIIPTYNRLPLLRRTLASVAAQTERNFEVIVVDDGSTDGTVDFLRAGEAGWRWIAQANRGPGAARNAGAAVARGDYLAFLDSDDLWFPWTAANYAAVAEREGRPAFITGKAFDFVEEAETNRAANGPLVVDRYADHLAAVEHWNWFTTSAFVVRRDAFLDVGGFTAQWGAEDADLGLRLGTAAGFVHLRAPVAFAYREQPVSLKSAPTYAPAGCRHMIATEKRGGYPGGATRARERRTALARQVRPVALACLHAGRRAEAWELYRATFGWQLRLGRWRFLAGFILQNLKPVARAGDAP